MYIVYKTWRVKIHKPLKSSCDDLNWLKRLYFFYGADYSGRINNFADDVR